MNFPEIDLELSSIVNYYQIRTYNHLSCINSANLVYNGVAKNFSIKVENPVLDCPCNLLNISTATPPIK